MEAYGIRVEPESNDWSSKKELWTQKMETLREDRVRTGEDWSKMHLHSAHKEITKDPCAPSGK